MMEIIPSSWPDRLDSEPVKEPNGVRAACNDDGVVVAHGGRLSAREFFEEFHRSTATSPCRTPGRPRVNGVTKLSSRQLMRYLAETSTQTAAPLGGGVLRCRTQNLWAVLQCSQTEVLREKRSVVIKKMPIAGSITRRLHFVTLEVWRHVRAKGLVGYDARGRRRTTRY